MDTLVVDCGLSTKGGHHVGHLLALFEAAGLNGANAMVLTNEKVDQRAINGITLLPRLSATGYEGTRSESLTAESFRSSEKSCWELLTLDFLKNDNLLSSARRILFINVTFPVFATACSWLRMRCNPLDRELSLYMLAGVGMKAVKMGTGLKMVDYDIVRKRTLTRQLQVLRELSPRAKIFVTSERRRTELAHLGFRNVRLYSLFTSEWERLSYRDPGCKPYVLLYTGDAKFGKGFPTIPYLLSRICSLAPDLEVVVHVSSVSERFKSTIIQIVEMAAIGRKVKLVCGHLSISDYAKQLCNATLVVLPNLRDGYFDMESGVFHEAMRNEVPVLCLNGTVSADELMECGGYEFILDDMSDVPTRTGQFLLDWPSVVTRFSRICERYKRRRVGTSVV